MTIVLPYRTPEALIAAVDAEAVETNPLYKQGRIQPGTTWCNLFASNVTKALGCEIPFLLVNSQVVYLRDIVNKWRECNAPTARARANAGYPTVGFWVGPDVHHGHIVVLLPSSKLPSDKRDQMACAQAGRSNFSYGRLATAFDSLPVEFMTHD